jgi:hypothetical protein
MDQVISPSALYLAMKASAFPSLLPNREPSVKPMTYNCSEESTQVLVASSLSVVPVCLSNFFTIIMGGSSLVLSPEEIFIVVDSWLL